MKKQFLLVALFSLFFHCVFANHFCAIPTNLRTSDIKNNSVKLEWDGVAGATYDIRYSTVPGGIPVVVTGNINTFLLLSGLNEATSYSFEVQANCGGTLSGYSSASSFSTISSIAALALKNTVTKGTKKEKYNALVLSTNFTLPIVRFNSANKNVTGGNPKGNVAFFNSLGAGISFNLAKLKITKDALEGDDDESEVNTEVSNIVGIQLGVIFSSNSASGSSDNVFAPTLSLTLLDFQFGFGYELGTIADSNKRTFFTIAYGIPISKLTEKGTFILKKYAESTSRSKRSSFLK
jgi:hypothetical protein